MKYLFEVSRICPHFYSFLYSSAKEQERNYAYKKTLILLLGMENTNTVPMLP